MVSVCKFLNSHPLLDPFFKLPLILVAPLVDFNPDTISLVVVPRALIVLYVLPSPSADTVLHPLIPLPLVYFIFIPSVCAFPVRFTSMIFSLVSMSICKQLKALALSQIPLPHTLITPATDIDHNTPAMSHPITSLPCIL